MTSSNKGLKSHNVRFVGLRIPNAELESVDKLAQLEDRSRSATIRVLIRQAMAERKKRSSNERERSIK